MPKDDPDTQLEPPSRIRITSVPHEDRFAIVRCTELVYQAMREPSKTARKGYENAARWFALAAREGR
jgi:surface antigen